MTREDMLIHAAKETAEYLKKDDSYLGFHYRLLLQDAIAYTPDSGVDNELGGTDTG